ncbi:hypothetical protein MAPG_04766 [Magnaporthiopsis poae ATCC 64411]|uniref:PD-(D/E)XK nuclease-like domain-containing protein n=1 Tax=Magnaporthiopsis poae (strain ATCC 64411 / 73-15) TaxID=644358 RepID=A0A0C4DXL2_MAGP6|nr:hypothetical protein MAPG_04766 [Magnaporthiopsis poae ATCC 64411]
MAQSVNPLCCSQCQVASWLDALDAPEIDTPYCLPGMPPSPKRKRPSRDSGGTQANPSSLSPKKRKPSEDDEDEDQETPMATTRPELRPLVPIPFRLHDLQQAPSSDSRSNTTSKATSERSRTSRTSTRSRATSPVKRTVALGFLSKPVSFKGVADDLAAQLTDDAARELLSQITRIADWKTGFIPGAARDTIQREVPNGKHWPSHWFQEGGQDEDRETRAAQRQFEILSDIVFEAKRSTTWVRGELAWNNLVHAPLLKLAARSASGSRNGGVVCEPAMGAGIANAWLPGIAKEQDEKRDAVAAGKMVDFVLALNVRGRPTNEPLHNAVLKLVGREPVMIQSINQTNYEPLVLNPIGVSIETKCNTGSADGNVQLGVWTAAWHQRMQSLLQSPVDITMPLLLCHGHDWNLYFACDRGHEIAIIGPIPIGGTHKLESVYPLFAVLIEICKWVEGPYRRWWETLLGIEADTSLSTADDT